MASDGVIRWGIHSTGHMAQKFVADLRLLTDARVVAVASRTVSAARRFAYTNEIPRSYGSAEDLINDCKVDVVYIAAPASLHAEVAMQYISACKPVLLEKPFTTASKDAAALVREARARDTFLMEAMWMRCLPGIRRLADLVRDSHIGEITAITAHFGRAGPFTDVHRLRRSDLGGGALFDMGVYPLHLAQMLLGTHHSVKASSVSASAGDVDELTAILLSYDRAVATLSCSIRGYSPNTAIIAGTQGHISLREDFISGRSVAIARAGSPPRELKWRYPGTGHRFQAAEVHRCLRSNLRESSLVPLDDSLAVIRTLEACRSPR